MASTEGLARCVQALPQELQDHILDFTLTSNYEVEIDNNYKPPVELAISQATRGEFAMRYYSKTTFTIDNLVLAQNWLRNLSPSHHAIISDVRIGVAPHLKLIVRDEAQALAGAMEMARRRRFMLRYQTHVVLKRTALKAPYWVVVARECCGQKQWAERRWASADGPVHK